MSTFGIYQIKNKVTGKCYIGSSNHVDTRGDEHFYSLRRGDHYNPHLQRAWNKYGEDSFEFSILERVLQDSTETDLREIETFWLHWCWPTGYNISNRGDHTLSFKGHRHTQDARQKISRAGKGRQSPRMTGKKHSPESIEKIRNSNRITAREAWRGGKRAWDRPKAGNVGGLFMSTFMDLMDSVATGELILLENGILQYYRKKNGEVTLSLIISMKPGVGQKLLGELYRRCLGTTIWVRCPISLPSNEWWQKRGYRFVRQETTRKGTVLNVYKLEVNDEGQVIRREGGGEASEDSGVSTVSSSSESRGG